MTPRDPQEVFEAAVTAVRDEPIDPRARQSALERAALRLRAELGEGETANAAATLDPAGDRSHRIDGCAGFRALLPAYRAGALAEPKRMLLEDHLRECVPCRRAWNELRQGAAPAAATVGRRSHRSAWRLAASLAGAALLAGGLWFGGGFFGPDVRAEVKSIDGALFALDGQTARPVDAGESFARGGVLRTSAGSRAVLELGDGSRVELGERAELRLDRRRDGVVLALDRGHLIVEAAEQRRGRLYVRTDDCLVSVVGTIFSVNSGARGSRVSVLDGEVRVRQGAELAVLRPGDQLATSGRLTRVPLEQDIAWSGNAAQYRERLQALRALGRELDSILASGEGRSSTRLLDIAPAGTVMWAAAPNLSQSLSEAWDLIEERVAEDPTLAAWWSERIPSASAEEIRAVLEDLRALGSHLGPEIAVAAGAGGDESGAPLLMAEVASPEAFAAAIDAELERLRAKNPEAANLVRVTDPAAAIGEEQVWLWIAPQGVLAVSPSGAHLRALAAALAAGESGFVGTPFHARLAAAYADGVEWLLAGDAGAVLHGVGAQQAEPAGNDAEALEQLGVADIQHLVVQSGGDGAESTHRAELSFRGERRGVAAWLAEPASSGALQFVSPDAQIAVAGLTKAPLEMLDDVIRFAERVHPDQVSLDIAAQQEVGLSLREDLAAALGGDVAFAIDGPWLPQPAWKAVIEVLDAARLQASLSRLVEVANREAAERGQPGLVLGEEAGEGVVYHRLSREGGGELAWYVFADGYLVAAPSRALLSQTLARRAAGSTLLSSQAFLDRLPRDGEPNFSALVWQNLGSSIGDFAQLVGGGEAAAALQASISQGPTLLLAYGGADRITLLATGAPGPLGMSLQSLLAMGEAVRARPQAAVSEDAAAAPVETPSRPAA